MNLRDQIQTLLSTKDELKVLSSMMASLLPANPSDWEEKSRPDRKDVRGTSAQLKFISNQYILHGKLLTYTLLLRLQLTKVTKSNNSDFTG